MNATKSKRIIALLAAIVLSVGLSLAVSASSTTEPPLLGGNLIWNIESIYYYVHMICIAIRSNKVKLSNIEL